MVEQRAYGGRVVEWQGVPVSIVAPRNSVKPGLV